MGWIAAVGLLAVALALLALLPLHLALSFRQENWQADLEVVVRVAFLRFRKRLRISESLAMALEHMWKRWQATGEPVDPDLRETVSRMPRRRLIRAALPALRRLGRATRCSRFRLRLEVGGGDACESALLAGVAWSGAGALLGLVSRWVRIQPAGLAVAVVPNFLQPVWRADLECILSVRLGKAIMAIVWLLRQELSRKEVIAWVRDSWRRKGDQTGGRTPDSRPDEDGHGKPEGHGGREHGDR